MRDQLQASGIPPATYIGQNGLYGRSDLAGLNLAQYPSILVECGNMKNPADSALMESPEGRQKYADAVVRGHRRLPGQPGRSRRPDALSSRPPSSGSPAPRPGSSSVPAARTSSRRSPSTPPAPCHVVLTVTLEPGPAGATVQLVTIDELASFSMTVWPATSTAAFTSRTRDLVACSFQLATVPAP